MDKELERLENEYLCYGNRETLTQEEYELLKEVLL